MTNFLFSKGKQMRIIKRITTDNTFPRRAHRFGIVVILASIGLLIGALALGVQRAAEQAIERASVGR